MRISSLLLAGPIICTALGFYFVHRGNFEVAIPLMLIAGLTAYPAVHEKPSATDKRLLWLERRRHPCR